MVHTEHFGPSLLQAQIYLQGLLGLIFSEAISSHGIESTSFVWVLQMEHLLSKPSTKPWKGSHCSVVEPDQNPEPSSPAPEKGQENFSLLA